MSVCGRLFRPAEASVPQVVSGIAFGVFFGTFWHPFGSFRAHFRSLLAKGCRKEPLDLLACSFLILHAVQRSKGRPKKGGTAVAGRMALSAVPPAFALWRQGLRRCAQIFPTPVGGGATAYA